MIINRFLTRVIPCSRTPSDKFYFANESGELFACACMCIATLRRDETLLATAYPSLDERGEPRTMPEKRRKERERKREREREGERAGEDGRRRGLFASECKPRLSALRSRSRARECASTHVRTYCAFDTYLRVKLPRKEAAGFL